MTNFMEGTYNKIPDEIREKLVELIVTKHYPIKEAARYVNIKYSTAKTIYKVYKNENRT